VSALERHFSVTELAERWHLAPSVVRDLFRNRPDVIRVSRPERMNKRSYTTIRIPESVVVKVYAELSGKRK